MSGVNFLAVSKADHKFKSEYGGFIGLGPYSNQKRETKYNFMYQLQQKGYIDHNIVSFYTSVKGEYADGKVDEKEKRASSVKFGSYDEEGLAPGEKLTMLKTANLDSWKLKFDGM